MNDFADFANFAIEAASVTKRFGGNVAIKDISLKIAPGEFFSFLGPSGCGKTTLLRMIAGFETPSEGDILINGKSVIAVPPHKRPVNMVFQSYALFPHLTVLENIAFGLKAKAGINKAEVIERSRAALELVRLAHLSERLPAQLSGGQQQRIALARAVVNRPAVLLLDEPLSALDPQIREEMQFELGRLQRNLGMTFVMVTHDQAEALALSTRVAVFCLGNLEQVGKPEEIYNQPRTLFVAKFIGQTNLLKGTLIQRNDGLARIELSGFSGPGSSSQPNQASAGGSTDKSATAAATETGSDSAKHSAHILTVRDSINQNDGAACATGDRVCVWVKPQAVELRLHDSTAATTAASGVAGLANSFPAEVVARSYQGVSTEYLLEFGDGAPPNRASMRACLRTGTKDGESAPFEVGDKVMVTIPEQASSFLSDCDFAGATSSAGAAPAGETDKGERQQAPIGAASL